MIRSALVVAGLAIGLFGATGAASAFITANTIDAHATHTADGTRVRATGPVGCTRGERISITVTITQAATRARAQRAWKRRCSGQLQHWAVEARSRRGTRFQAGRGRVCAVGSTRDRSGVTDTRRWCEGVRVSGGFR